MRIIRFKTKKEKQKRRRVRIRVKVFGTADRPRLSVFKSNKHIFAQLIDDENKCTIVSAGDVSKSEAHSKKTAGDKTNKTTGQVFAKVAKAQAVGELIAQKALAKKIKQVVFDRGGNRYTGRIKAVAEGARAGGLKF